MCIPEVLMDRYFCEPPEPKEEKKDDRDWDLEGDRIREELRDYEKGGSEDAT